MKIKTLLNIVVLILVLIGTSKAFSAVDVATKMRIGDENGDTALVTDHQALQVTPPSEGKSAFGEALVSQVTPLVNLSFRYNVNQDRVDYFDNKSGSVTQANAMAVIATGAATNSSGEIRSKDQLRYVPGLGASARFTAVFTTGVAGSSQGAGIGNSANGFYFGYDGATFGILHRKNGSPEIRTLTVSAKSSTAENITITLDGDSTGDVVPVTNGADATVTANEIAAYDYSDVGRGWKAQAVGNTVIFISYNSTPRTGTYSLSSASTAVGTFAQTVAGVAPTDTWIPQSDWNGRDKFDGSGNTGVQLDPTKGNVYKITYQWLGFGRITFSVEDPDDGEFHEVHSIAYANSNTAPSVSNPTLPLNLFAINTSNNSNIVVKSASMGGFIEGVNEVIGARRAKSASITLGATAAETPILTLKNKAVYQGNVNTIPVKIERVNVAVEHTKPVGIAFYRNTTLVGASFSDYSANTSVLQTDTSATSFSSSGTLLFSVELGKTGNDTIYFPDWAQSVINPGETITATIKPKSGNAAEATVSVSFVELF